MEDTQRGYLIAMLQAMAHSKIHNYVLPGLTSSLIGGPTEDSLGTVRLFEASREQHMEVTPHSHRFDFHCLVLQGTVTNILWTDSDQWQDVDMYTTSELHYKGECGLYHSKITGNDFYRPIRTLYHAGDWYCMTHDQIHSVEFSRDAVVLFIEGPTISNMSVILEPCVNGDRIPTLKVESWMFQKGK